MSHIFTITVPNTHRRPSSFQTTNSNVIAPAAAAGCLDKKMDDGSDKPRKTSGPHVVEYGSLNKQRKLKVILVTAISI